MSIKKKPDCKLIGKDGNIFNLMGIASRTLRQNGMAEQAVEMRDRICASGSYGEALCIIGDYVNITGDDASDEDMDFEIAAENGNHYAEYMLGKMYLYGKEVEQDYAKSIAYLTASAEHGNQYAAQLLHSIKSNRNWSATLGSLRLLGQINRIIQDRLEDEHKWKGSSVDRKLKRKIDEKKQAQGLKLG